MTTMQLVGEYELVEKIGEGGMATVYRARQRRTGAVVALKMALPAVAANPTHRQRFEQEFRTAAKLSHPAIVRALEFGESDGVPYFTMELVDGPDLWQLIGDRGRLPEPEAIRLISQVAEALHEAHLQGIIHRDVKPDNILITSDGNAKLTDLGLIKDLDADLNLTRTQRGLGTPNFMAPEQFSNAKRVGVASDIYSLGATLYMAVTGEMPFQSKAIGAILKKKLCNELTPPRQLVRSLSERVDFAIRRALRADPKQRQATCLEFVQTLAQPTTDTSGSPPPSDGLSSPDLKAFFPPNVKDERRAWVRYPCQKQTSCNVRTSIHEDDTETKDCWRATVHDLSVTGVGLLVSRRFEPRTVLTVVLESRNRSHIRTIEMRVKRVTAGANGEWRIGGAFAEQLSREELQRLL